MTAPNARPDDGSGNPASHRSSTNMDACAVRYRWRNVEGSDSPHVAGGFRRSGDPGVPFHLDVEQREFRHRTTPADGTRHRRWPTLHGRVVRSARSHAPGRRSVRRVRFRGARSSIGRPGSVPQQHDQGWEPDGGPPCERFNKSHDGAPLVTLDYSRLHGLGVGSTNPVRRLARDDHRRPPPLRTHSNR